MTIFKKVRLTVFLKFTFEWKNFDFKDPYVLLRALKLKFFRFNVNCRKNVRRTLQKVGTNIRDAITLIGNDFLGNSSKNVFLVNFFLFFSKIQIL